MCGLVKRFSPQPTLREQDLVSPRGSEEFFAKLDAYASVKCANDRVPKRYFGLIYERNEQRIERQWERRANLSGYGLDDPRKIMVFPLSVPCPGSEVPELAIVPIICQPHLWTDEKDFLVINNDSAVVVDILVVYRPARRSTDET